MGEYYKRMKNYESAVSNYLVALNITPNDISLLEGIAYSYWSINIKKSAEFFSKIIELDPLNTNAYYYRGWIYSDYLPNYQKAIDDFTQILSLDSNYFGALNNRANAYRSAGLYENAIADFSKSIANDEVMNLRVDVGGR